MTALSTEALLAPAGPPALRLVPAPVCAPPYDDERPDGGVLVLPLPALRAVPDPRPARPVPPPDPPEPVEAWLAPTRTPTAALPASREVARTMVQGLLEVLAGLRPVSQLRRDITPEVYAALQATLAGRPRPAGARPDGRAVRSLHVQERPEGVAEVCATVVRGARAGALALRLEGLDGRWRCTGLAGV